MLKLSATFYAWRDRKVLQASSVLNPTNSKANSGIKILMHVSKR